MLPGQPMRVIFMGAPDFAVASLQAIIAAGHDVAAVYSKAPSRAGRRGLEIVKSPVHRFAEANDLTIFTPDTLKDVAVQDELRGRGAQTIVVAAYGLLLPQAVLSTPAMGCLNVHASLLPRWRGAAPIQRAIMSGDAMTGVCIMKMEAGLDTGPVCLRETFDISDRTTAGELTESLALVGARLIVTALGRLSLGQLQFVPQIEAQATYAKKVLKAETLIDWTASAVAVRNHIHGLSPSPGAYAEIQFRNRAERVRCLLAEVIEEKGAPGAILDDRLTIACGQGAVRIVLAQRAGKLAMPGAELMRGANLRAGDRFLPHPAVKLD